MVTSSWLSHSVWAQVDIENHKKCIDAKDYVGCIKANQAQSKSTGVTSSSPLSPVSASRDFSIDDSREVKEAKCSSYILKTTPHFGSTTMACKYFSERYSQDFCDDQSDCVWLDPLAVIQMSMRYAGEYYANQQLQQVKLEAYRQEVKDSGRKESSLSNLVLLDSILNKSKSLMPSNPVSCFGFGSANVAPLGSSVNVTSMSSTQCF